MSSATCSGVAFLCAAETCQSGKEILSEVQAREEHRDQTAERRGSSELLSLVQRKDGQVAEDVRDGEDTHKKPVTLLQMGCQRNEREWNEKVPPLQQQGSSRRRKKCMTCVLGTVSSKQQFRHAQEVEHEALGRFAHGCMGLEKQGAKHLGVAEGRISVS